MSDLVSSVVSDAALVSARRKELVAAATQLFLKQGFHKTSVRQIASAAGWQMGTLYLYVKSKEDVLFLFLDDVGQQQSEGLDLDESDGTAEEHLSSIFLSYMRTIHRLRREIRLIYRESASLKPEHLAALKETELSLRGIFEGVIERGVESGEFSPGDVVLRAQNFLMLAAMWPLKRWALGHIEDVDNYARAQLEVLLRELRADPMATDVSEDCPTPS